MTTFDPAANFRPFPGQRSMIDTSRPAGGVNMKAVYKNLTSAGFEPKYPVSLEAMDKQRQGLDYLDLARDYNNVVVERPSDELTSAMLNARNTMHLTTIAPILYTEQQNFTIRDADVLQVPFDQVGPGAIARITTYNTRERFASLNMFKRALRFEMTKVQDETFGPGALAQGMQSLRTQAEMTLCGMVAYALVDFPYMQRMARLNHPMRGFSHQREMLIAEEETAWLNHVDATALVQKMIHMRNSYNKLDMAVVPGGAMTIVANSVGESRPMPAYQFVLDSDLRKYLMVSYDGVKSLTSIPLGDGTTFNIAENFAQRISIMDGEEEEIQALRTEITLGEAGLMPIRAADAPYEVNTKFLDIGLADHQENEVTPKRISFGEMMKNCLIWYSRRGDETENPKDTDWGADLLAAYEPMKDDIIRYFRDGNFDDNDKVPSQYLSANLPINQMYGFRHFFGFVALPTEERTADAPPVDKLAFPEFIGDLEPKTFPPMHAVRGAAMLERLGKFDVNDPSADGWSKLIAFSKRYFPDASVPAAVYTNAGTFERFYETLIKATTYDKTTVIHDYVTKDTPLPTFGAAALRSATSFRIDARSPLMPRAAESLADYTARLDTATLAKAVSTGEIAGGWAHVLAHTADNAVPAVKEIFFAAHQADELTHDQAQALQHFGETMANYSTRPHTKEIADRAVTLMRNGGNAVEAIRPQDGAAYLSTVTEARLNSLSATPAVLATSVRQVLGTSASGASGDGDGDDAMNIDEPRRGTSSIYPVASGDVEAKRQTRYTWQQFGEAQQMCESDVQKYLYAMIIRSKFSKKACVALASAGFEVFRIVALKFNIHFLVDSIALLHAGYETMQMAFGHVIVLTGVDADAGYLTINAQFHAGVICWKPEYLDMIPFAIGNRILGGRNNNAVTRVDEMFATYAGRPSIVYVPTPVTETKYHFPLSLNNDAIYGAPNTEGVNAYHKGSWRDLLNVYAGDFHEGLIQPSTYRENTSFYETSLIAGNIHRACTWYYGDSTSDRMRPMPGTGQLGPIGRNVPGAHRAFNGVGNFPTNYETAMVF